MGKVVEVKPKSCPVCKTDHTDEEEWRSGNASWTWCRKCGAHYGVSDGVEYCVDELLIEG